MDQISKVIKSLKQFGYSKIIFTILLIVVFLMVSRLVRKWLNKLAERYQKKRILIKNFIPLFNIALNIVGVLIILFWILEIPANSLLTIGVSAGIAIGFAVKDLLANVFAGLVIIFTRPFNIGDKISVDNYYGEVTDVSLLRVTITTSDDSAVSIPSKSFLETSVVNANSGALDCQVVTKILLPGNVDLQVVKRVAKEAVYSSPFVYLKKPVTILFQDEYRETSLVQLKIKAYVYDHRYEYKFSADIYERIKRYFRQTNFIDSEFYRLP